MNEISTPNAHQKQPKRKWCVTEEKDDVTKKIEVREATNGFIIKKCISGYKKNDKGEKEWFDEESETISKTNPLEKKSMEDETREMAKSYNESMTSMSNGLGMIKID